MNLESQSSKYANHLVLFIVVTIGVLSWSGRSESDPSSSMTTSGCDLNATIEITELCRDHQSREISLISAQRSVQNLDRVELVKLFESGKSKPPVCKISNKVGSQILSLLCQAPDELLEEDVDPLREGLPPAPIGIIRYFFDEGYTFEVFIYPNKEAMSFSHGDFRNLDPVAKAINRALAQHKFQLPFWTDEVGGVDFSKVQLCKSTNENELRLPVDLKVGCQVFQELSKCKRVEQNNFRLPQDSIFSLRFFIDESCLVECTFFEGKCFVKDEYNSIILDTKRLNPELLQRLQSSAPMLATK